MRTRAEIAKEIQDVSARIDEIFAKEIEEDGDQTELETLSKKLEALNDEMKALDTREKVAARKSEIVAGLKKPVTKPSATVIEGVRDRAEDDPKFGYNSPREFLMDVINAARSGDTPNRLRPLSTAGSDEQGTYSDPYGGFLVPAAFLTDMKAIGFEGDPTASYVTSVPMTAPIVNIPARVDKDHSSSVSGGLRVYRRAEADTVTASRMALQNIRLEANSLMGITYVTEELLSESPVSFAAILARGFNDEFGATILNEKLNGTGAGQYLGVTASPAYIEVAKQTGQAADTIYYENIINMRARVWGYNNAIWLANHDTLPQLMTLSYSIGTSGVLVWQPSATPDKPDMLLGRPIYFTEFCKTLGDAGDILCCNFGEYLEGTYSPVQGAESIHVRFVNHERTFKFWTKNAGSPWWSSAMTPKNSTSTLSPFVGLAARA